MDDHSPHEMYMNRCLELAAKGLGRVAPNPMVGCVIVHKDRIIGEGYHQEYGKPHAEVNAIASVQNQQLLKESTLYVNLEPCSHTGKTPPCSQLIIEMGIPGIVIGTPDPNRVVAGRGIEALKSAGRNVTTGILSEECLKLNRRFHTFHEKKRPYVILKWAYPGRFGNSAQRQSLLNCQGVARQKSNPHYRRPPKSRNTRPQRNGYVGRYDNHVPRKQNT